jgi:hypothetical protein
MTRKGRGGAGGQHPNAAAARATPCHRQASPKRGQATARDHLPVVSFAVAGAPYVAHFLFVDTESAEFWRVAEPVVGWAVTCQESWAGAPDVTVQAMVQLDVGSPELATAWEYAGGVRNAYLVGVYPEAYPPAEDDFERARGYLIEKARRAA